MSNLSFWQLGEVLGIGVADGATRVIAVEQETIRPGKIILEKVFPKCFRIRQKKCFKFRESKKDKILKMKYTRL